eukprot:GEMP01054044.1.p1 GENE.GEMP01054044.1~~GEMP01054044.1.p1  ORF type:complete len:428 (+),score=77.01 GEMP01054044.1:105-1388(+)
MLRLSRLLIFSPEGDTLINKEFRGDVAHVDPTDLFLRVAFCRDAAPVIQKDGVHYVSLLRRGLIICGVTRDNVSPTFAVHLLESVCDAIATLFGFSLDEIELNRAGIYELIDEMIHFGYVMTTDTAELRSRVSTTRVLFVDPLGGHASTASNHRTVPTIAINRPSMLRRRDVTKCRQSELYVDIKERITVSMSRQGVVSRSEIHGKILAEQRITELEHVVLELNRNLRLGKEQSSYGSVILQDVVLHEGINSTRLHDNILSFALPRGLHCVLEYTIQGDFRLPFRLLPRTENGQFDLTLRADFSSGNRADNLVISFSTPDNISATPEVDGGKAAFRPKENRVAWKIARMTGGSELKLRCRIRPKSHAFQVSCLEMTYPCPQNVSNLHVRSFRLAPPCAEEVNDKDDHTAHEALRQMHRRYSKRLSAT